MKNFSIFSLTLLLLIGGSALAMDFYVSPAGIDGNPGTPDKPLQTLSAAQKAARNAASKGLPVTVHLDGGTYYLSSTLVFTQADSGTPSAPILWEAMAGKNPVISGGVKLSLQWQPHKGGIFQTKVSEDLKTEEIFVNGERQILARYPNFDSTAKYFDGFAKDAISNERAATWSDPSGGFFHAMHPALWGDFTWVITGKDAAGKITMEGGWQNNRGGAMHNEIRFVENIFEELDSPGEWFLNQKTHILYFYPPQGMELKTATVEATRLRSLVEFQGDETHPVRFVSLKGITFRQAARTVMDTKEPLLRTDWAIYRGGAIFFNGAEDCSVDDCLLDQLGGNAVFVNNYNRRIAVRGCEIVKAGASGVSFVGDQKAVRSPLFNYGKSQKLESIDLTPGPLTNNYPADCLVEDCLIHLTGRVEKQSAGIEIDIAQGITVRHCSIYDMPRAGINIGDGCFGGHIVEYCDIFDTVKETGDHGSFNSWGRDRFWNSDINTTNAWVNKVPSLPLLDVVKPNILRNSRWRCDHGWDIDLDDGSSNYIITNNLMLHGGLKFREGFERTAENNVLVNGGLSAHVWYQQGHEIFRRNIVFGGYSDARMPKTAPWGKDLDYNLVQVAGKSSATPAKALQAKSHRDEHSIEADAMFVDAAHGNFQVKPGSPALALGFKNFPMDEFGVQKASLKAIARVPVIGKGRAEAPKRGGSVHDWLTATVRNIIGQSEMSAYGTPGETGVLVLSVPLYSALAKAGLQKDDVILTLDGRSVPGVDDLVRLTSGLKSGQIGTLGVLRLQKLLQIPLVVPRN